MIRATTIFGALVALTATAAAQSTERTCEVRFVRAPDDVRHVIETWLAAEPRCTSTIDLRVIPTEQGFYLIAQRPDGRLHERFVPDAQSAGVLVASWVADDWVTPSSVWTTPRPAGAQNQPALVPPQNTRATSSISAVGAPRARDRHAARWVSLGTMLGTNSPEHIGMRLEIDLASRGNFTLGAAGAATQSSQTMYTYSGDGALWAADYAATLYGAYTLRSPRWELRTALGIGAVYSDVEGLIDSGPGEPWPNDAYLHAAGTGTTATASMILTARMGERWGIHGGLLTHLISESFETDQGMGFARKDAQLFFFTGVRFRL